MHWRIILRNICSNWAGYAVTALIGFFLSPFIVHSLGTTGYGLWTLVLSLTGYFGLLDFGIRSSVGRFVARYLALNDDESGNRILSTAFAILLGGGLLALSATIVVVTFFFGSFHVDMHFELAAKVALLITGLTMSCALPLGTFSSLLVAMERFDILSGVTIIAELTRAGLIVVFLRGGHGLVSVALIALFTSIAQYVTMALFAKALHHPLKLRVSFVDRRAFKELFGFGVFRFIWIVANQLIFYSDAVVIGIFLGAGVKDQLVDLLLRRGGDRDLPRRRRDHLLCHRRHLDQLRSDLRFAGHRHILSGGNTHGCQAGPGWTEKASYLRNTDNALDFLAPLHWLHLSRRAIHYIVDGQGLCLKRALLDGADDSPVHRAASVRVGPGPRGDGEASGPGIRDPGGRVC